MENETMLYLEWVKERDENRRDFVDDEALPVIYSDGSQLFLSMFPPASAEPRARAAAVVSAGGAATAEANAMDVQQHEVRVTSEESIISLSEQFELEDAIKERSEELERAGAASQPWTRPRRPQLTPPSPSYPQLKTALSSSSRSGAARSGRWSRRSTSSWATTWSCTRSSRRCG